MVKLISVIGFVALLSGCGYDIHTIEDSRTACKELGGKWSAASFWSADRVEAAYCTFNGIKYEYMVGNGSFDRGRIVNDY